MDQTRIGNVGATGSNPGRQLRESPSRRRRATMVLIGAIASGVVLTALPAGAALASTSNVHAVAPPKSSLDSGWIRFGHFVPSQGPVTVRAGDVLLGTNLVFRAVTPYISVKPGVLAVTVRSATALPSAAPLAVGEADVVRGGAVTVVAVAASGTTSTAGTDGPIKLQTYEDNLAAPSPGEAKVRVIHTVPGAPEVTAQLTPSSSSAASLTSQRAISLNPVAYGEASPYKAVPAGTYELKVAPVGKAPIITGENWPVTAGTVASIVLVAAATGPTVEVLSDAVGASSMPKGGMQTGFGGTAQSPVGPILPLSAAVGVLLLGGAALRRRLRGRPATSRLHSP